MALHQAIASDVTAILGCVSVLPVRLELYLKGKAKGRHLISCPVTMKMTVKEGSSSSGNFQERLEQDIQGW